MLFLWIVGGLLTHAGSFAAGYYLFLNRVHIELGDRALSGFMTDLAALTFLEKGDSTAVRQTLTVELDGHLLDMSRYGTPVFDKRRPDAKQKLVLQYAQIRKKYPPVDYRDGGVMNSEVGRALQSLGGSQ